MKRDMDLVRDILKGAAGATGPFDALSLKGGAYDAEAIAYHVRIMQEAGLVEARLVGTFEGPTVAAFVDGITWRGSDFLDAVDNDTVWRRVRVKMAQMAGTATFEIVKAMAEQELSRMLLQ